MSKNSFSFSTGDIDEAVDVMREAAGWLIDSGVPLWKLEDLTKENLLKENSAEEFYIFRVNDESAGAMILKWHDPFFWPNAETGESGYIHKLSVRRKYAGKGVSIKMIDQAIEECRKRKAAYLKLDCDPGRRKLCDFYANLGFIRVDRRMIGPFDIAFYEFKLPIA